MKRLKEDGLMKWLRRFKRAGGQAMLEYVVTMLLASLGLIGVGLLMQLAIHRYLFQIYFITSLPVP